MQKCFFCLVFLFLLIVTGQLSAQEAPTTRSFISSLSYLTQTVSQNYQRFNMLGYERKEKGIMPFALVGFERKKTDGIYFHVDLGLGIGENDVTLSSRDKTQEDETIAKGSMETYRIESSLLGGYSFLVGGHRLTPFIGFHLLADGAHADARLRYISLNTSGKTELALFEALYVVGIKDDILLNNKWTFSPTLRLEKSLVSINETSVEFSGRDDASEKASSIRIQTEFPFAYQLNRRSRFVATASYGFAYRSKIFTSAAQTRHLFGLSASYNLCF